MIKSGTKFESKFIRQLFLFLLGLSLTIGIVKNVNISYKKIDYVKFTPLNSVSDLEQTLEMLLAREKEALEIILNRTSVKKFFKIKIFRNLF